MIRSFPRSFYSPTLFHILLSLHAISSPAQGMVDVIFYFICNRKIRSLFFLRVTSLFWFIPKCFEWAQKIEKDLIENVSDNVISRTLSSDNSGKSRDTDSALLAVVEEEERLLGDFRVPDRLSFAQPLLDHSNMGSPYSSRSFSHNFVNQNQGDRNAIRQGTSLIRSDPISASGRPRHSSSFSNTFLTSSTLSGHSDALYSPRLASNSGSTDFSPTTENSFRNYGRVPVDVQDPIADETQSKVTQNEYTEIL